MQSNAAGSIKFSLYALIVNSSCFQISVPGRDPEQQKELCGLETRSRGRLEERGEGGGQGGEDDESAGQSEACAGPSDQSEAAAASSD